MIAATEKVTLKDGETVDFSILRAPDAEWADALMGLIGHKGETWNWQNEQALRVPIGLEMNYYFLHRGRKGFSNVTTSENNGIGLFGHVWTEPDDRRKGACSLIMERQMADFDARGGRYLSLGTGYDTAPYHIYKKFGFEGVEANNGYMVYSKEPLAQFQEDYFAPCDAVIEPVDWKHWPTVGVLFISDLPGVIRSAPVRAFGLTSAESPMIPLLMDRYKNKPETIRGQVLVNPQTQAAVGIGTWGYAAQWPGTVVADVFCHPNFWHRAPELLQAMTLPDAEQVVGYVDDTCPGKRDAFESLGFREVGRLAQWVRVRYSGDARADVTVMARR
ncbi:MAG: hypothetical protein O3A51_02360 [Verrucomicrobia bacterium]|nr:hypothetical protein [Verrucomicrobiota bacterium]